MDGTSVMTQAQGTNGYFFNGTFDSADINVFTDTKGIVHQKKHTGNNVTWTRLAANAQVKNH